jgi:hypothetical protein
MVVYTIAEKVGALAIVFAVAVGAGLVTGLFFGFTFPSISWLKFKGYRWNSIIPVV